MYDNNEKKYTENELQSAIEDAYRNGHDAGAEQFCENEDKYFESGVKSAEQRFYTGTQKICNATAAIAVFESIHSIINNNGESFKQDIVDAFINEPCSTLVGRAIKIHIARNFIAQCADAHAIHHKLLKKIEAGGAK